MSRSLLRRLAGYATAAGLAVTTLSVAGAAPAQAAQTCATTTVVSVLNRVQTFKAYNSVQAEVDANCPEGSPGLPLAGSLLLQRSVDGGRTWTTVKSGNSKAGNGTSSSYISYFGNGIAPRNSIFRGFYQGGADDFGNTYQPSSAVVGVKVIRLVRTTDKSTSRASRAKFDINPAKSIRGLTAKFQVKSNGAWRLYKKVRVPRDGNFIESFRNSRKGIKYRLLLPGKRGFTASKHGPYTALRR